jgi:DNA recombination protein RmuC
VSLEILVGAAIVLQLVILAVLLMRRQGDPAAQMDAAMQRVRAELELSRGEQQRTAGELRGELNARLDSQITALQRGLGEMQALTSGMDDLRKVLGNVKVRGIWGEYQLGGILEQFLTSAQYVANYVPDPISRESVEYAVKFPGRDGAATPLHLPIDAKFPQEDFLRLVEASESGDAADVRAAREGLMRAVRKAAKDISSKYVRPPVTTDFAVMFLPTESLFAEVAREPGLLEEMQREYRVSIAGPTTLAALLTSLRMGFHSLAIEQRAGEVRELLGAVKAEFGKFNDTIARAQKQLATVGVTLDETGRRTRAMERKLRDVEAAPGPVADRLLELGAGPEVDSDS